MSFPTFFDQVPTISLRDPLAEFLGAASDGIIEYTYTDIVKLAGHSCPTVAGAYLMTIKALQKLYGNALPERGAIKVEFSDSQLNGVTGVIANVVSFITGATTDNGFKGLKGQFDRRNLLVFNAPHEGAIKFQRIDTGASVTVSFNSAVVPASPELMPALFNSLTPSASPEQRQQFARQWQDRVKRIFENADHPELIVFL
ncbi:hypothetical protein GCM10011450_13340 [Advenella faeciporci]|uniref:Formylmethanofuran dehydrogenase subunit E domain-containing protein n=1 Tax=Advenella faeciporci TaxID=797535 RepID=A0A918JMZ8_9BURK|nr:FmdE family protein [Advenella faeciporci]NLY35081.1 hypothetical protein [Alcaligenaceae bacterium]GGW84678.1 hypothetical protein GCM10011450_13340 [Advenella faeciporci]